MGLGEGQIGHEPLNVPLFQLKDKRALLIFEFVVYVWRSPTMQLSLV